MSRFGSNVQLSAYDPSDLYDPLGLRSCHLPVNLRLHSTILERVPAVKYDLAGIVPQRYRVVPKR